MLSELLGALSLAGAGTAAGLGAVVGAAVVVGALRSAAFAWREERDAERSKAERFEALFQELHNKYTQLETRYEEVARSRDFEAALSQVTATLELLRESMSDGMRGVQEGLMKNTTVLEFIAKETFPLKIARDEA